MDWQSLSRHTKSLNPAQLPPPALRRQRFFDVFNVTSQRAFCRQAEFYKTTRFRAYRLRIGSGRFCQNFEKTCQHIKSFCRPKHNLNPHENRTTKTTNIYETISTTCQLRHISETDIADHPVVFRTTTTSAGRASFLRCQCLGGDFDLGCRQYQQWSHH